MSAWFAWARARAAPAPLVALAVISAIAAGLASGVVAAVRAVEAQAVVAAVETAGGADADRVIVRFDTGAADAVDVAEAVGDALSASGAGGALAIDRGDASGTLLLRVDPTRVTGDAALNLIAALPDLRGEVRDRLRADVQVSGGLRSSLLAAQDGIESRRGPTSVAVGIVALMTAVTVAAVAVEPVRSRAGETGLLRARGARRRSLVAIASVETALVAGVGAGVGAIAGGVATTMLSGLAIEPIVGAAAAAATAAVAVTSAAIAAVSGADRRPGRADAAAGATAVLLAAVLTGIAVWQFAQHGTPMVVGGDGDTVLDPIVMMAPALLLAWTGVAAVLLAAPAARVVAAWTARGRRVVPATPLRLAARRPARHALTTASVAFSLGAVILAASYVGTIASLGDTPEAVRVGADVRVTSVPDGDPVAWEDVLGAEAAMEVLSTEARGSRAPVAVLAVEGAEMPQVMSDADGALDLQGLAVEVVPRITGIALPGGGDLQIRIRTRDVPPLLVDGETVTSGPPVVTAQVWLADADGRVSILDAESFTVSVESDPDAGEIARTEASYDRTTTVPMPAGGPWSIVSVTAVDHQGWTEVPGVRIDVATDSADVDLAPLEAAPGTPGSVEARGSGLEFVLPAAEHDDPVPTRAVVDSMPRSAVAALTQGLADSLGVGVRGELSLRLASLGVDVDLQVTEVIPVLPGTPDGQGVLTDLGALSLVTGQAVSADEAWIATDEPFAVATRIAEDVPEARTVLAEPGAAESAAATGFAFLVAAGAATTLAVCVLLLRRSRDRTDARELALLAVLGLGRRRAGRVRAAEDLFAVAAGVMGGVVAGVTTAWLVVPSLVRAAYPRMPDGVPVDLTPDVLLLVGGVLLASALFAVAAGSSRAPRVLAPWVREEE